VNLFRSYSPIQDQKLAIVTLRCVNLYSKVLSQTYVESESSFRFEVAAIQSNTIDHFWHANVQYIIQGFSRLG